MVTSAAERLPHVGNGGGHLLVVVVGVEADVDLERLAALAVAGLLQEVLGLVLTVELVEIGPLGLGGV